MSTPESTKNKLPPMDAPLQASRPYSKIHATKSGIHVIFVSSCCPPSEEAKAMKNSSSSLEELGFTKPY